MLAAMLRETLSGANSLSRLAFWFVNRVIAGGAMLAIAAGACAVTAMAQTPPAGPATQPASSIGTTPGASAQGTAAAPPPAQESANPTAQAASGSLHISRNWFARETQRPEVTLTTGQPLSLGRERATTGGASHLKIVSPDPEVGVALRFRTLPEPGRPWELTVILVTRERPHDFFYLTQGELIANGELKPQTEFRVEHGIETELTTKDAPVRDVIVQDEGDAEIRIQRSDGTVTLNVVPGQYGGRAVAGSEPWYANEPLRFLDYNILAGGYSKAVLNNDYTGWILPSSTTEHGFAEAWVANAVGVRVAAFSLTRESFAVGQLVYQLQAMRGEWWSVWLEAGAAAHERTLSPAHGQSTQTSDVGWTAGATGNVRFGRWGGQVHWADTDGPSVLQVLAGWQATRKLGLALSWISYRNAEPLGLAASWQF